MDQRKRMQALGIVLLAFTFAGCTATPESVSTSPSPMVTNTPMETPAPTEATVTAYFPTNEKVLTASEPQSGIGEFTDINPSSESIAVYVSCQGQGDIQVDLSTVGSFPLDCGDETSTVRNVFDVGSADLPITVKVQALDTTTWSMTVSELPAGS